MARLVYSLGTSLDGFVEDAEGGFGWSAPAEDVHRLANEEVREAQALLYGRRMFEVMEPYWPQVAAEPDGHPEIEADFARAYVATPRIVFSDTLESAPEGVRLVRSADAVAEVTRLKQRPGGPLGIGGPGLAGSLVDLIDEFRLWVNPILVGAGKRYLPDGTVELELLSARTMTGGVLYLRYGRR